MSLHSVIFLWRAKIRWDIFRSLRLHFFVSATKWMCDISTSLKFQLLRLNFLHVRISCAHKYFDLSEVLQNLKYTYFDLSENSNISASILLRSHFLFSKFYDVSRFLPEASISPHKPKTRNQKWGNFFGPWFLARFEIWSPTLTNRAFATQFFWSFHSTRRRKGTIRFP